MRPIAGCSHFPSGGWLIQKCACLRPDTSGFSSPIPSMRYTARTSGSPLPSSTDLRRSWANCQAKGCAIPPSYLTRRDLADNCRFLGVPVFRRLVCIGTNMEACRRLIRHARCVDRCCRAYTRSIASVTSYRSFRERVCRRTRASIRAVERSTGRRLKMGCSKICLTADRLLTSYHTFLYILALISCTHYTLAFHHHFSRTGTRPRVLS